MLQSIAHHTRRHAWDGAPDSPVAWRSIDRGPGGELDDDYFGPRAAWNREQTVRRALRSLERRGLVTLGQYVFAAEPAIDHGFARIEWVCIDPNSHIPGETRIMTGALLTVTGWELVRSKTC